jgi:drug/metabolite transporter (DMT)-like permease
MASDPLASNDRTSVALALGAAVLFGLSAPAGKTLLAVTDPWLLAGLLYLGSGVALGVFRLARRAVSGAPAPEAAIARADWPWLGGAILTGGVAGPVLLMFGLARATSSETALLLNLEGVFTAVLAWVVFREHVDGRIAAGMVAIAAGAMVLGWDPAGGVRLTAGALLVAGACLAWAIDNNLTRKVAASDAVQITAVKGMVAGAANIAIALSLGAGLPGPGTIAAAAAVGLVSYGLSLVLFVRALRGLGAGRTSAYFSTAPFVGAVVGVLALGDPVHPRLALAGVLMALGVWLHATEHHEHEHVHEDMRHEHRHAHDAHHQHLHGPGDPPGDVHSHWHHHAALRHGHPHYPDIHHRHGH